MRNECLTALNIVFILSSMRLTLTDRQAVKSRFIKKNQNQYSKGSHFIYYFFNTNVTTELNRCTNETKKIVALKFHRHTLSN